MRTGLLAAITAALIAAPANADWFDFKMHGAQGGEGQPVASVEAVDSWFTTLATLLFQYEPGALAPGTYGVAMLAQTDCADASAGQVYRRPDDQDIPSGVFGEIEMAADGTGTRSISIHAERLGGPLEKLTVGELRGHVLVFHAPAMDGAAPAVIACGTMPEAAEMVPPE